MDDLKERRGHSHLKEKALHCAMCTGGFGRGFGPVVKQATVTVPSGFEARSGLFPLLGVP
jgi:hypothetical protein